MDDGKKKRKCWVKTTAKKMKSKEIGVPTATGILARTTVG